LIEVTIRLVETDDTVGTNVVRVNGFVYHINPIVQYLLIFLYLLVHCCGKRRVSDENALAFNV
jgi:hypothetical protein